MSSRWLLLLGCAALAAAASGAGAVCGEGEGEHVQCGGDSVMKSNAVIDMINTRMAKEGTHPFWAYIHVGSNLPKPHRLYLLEEFFVFAFTFGDTMSVVRKHYQEAKDAGEPDVYGLREPILEHVADDMGHYEWLVEDFQARRNQSDVTLDEMHELLYHPKQLYMRVYGYQVMSLTLQNLDNPVALAYLLEAFEVTSKRFIREYSIEAEKCSEVVGVQFKYFGAPHLDVELGHDSLLERLADISLTPAEEAHVVAVVEEHFNNAWKMFSGSLSCTYDYEDHVREKYNIDF